MKVLIKSILLALCISVSMPARGQIDLLKKAKEKAEKKAQERVDKKVDEGLDKVFGKKKKTESDTKTTQPADQKESTVSGSTEQGPATGVSSADAVAASPTGVLNWAKYDFVPGDKIIFEDDLMFEENGEFPSRWDLFRGVVEVAELDGENVIMFRGGQPSIIPYLENSSSDYLPDVFTIEFDVYLGGTGGWTQVYLWDQKNQDRPRGEQVHLEIRSDELSIYGSQSNYPVGNLKRNRWIHISIAYTSGKFKAYMDDTRLINIPRLDINPTGISLYSYHASNENPMYFRNIRIAEGGVKYYDRVMKDGKIVANGIRFDVGKASLRPESMGIINEVVELMQKHPDLKFSVEGHTDSDGDDKLNLELSENRAQSVMQAMVKMGISSDRLQSRGWGESKPITGNASPEDKANNRRVEFVKL